MIRKGKLMNALHALNGVLVRARTMAFEDEACKDLAKILDYAEELPLLIMMAEDKTESFRQSILEISEKFRCPSVLERFDAPESSFENWRC